MNRLIITRTGKLLFPHLPRELRKQQLFKLLFVVLATLCCNTTLVWFLMRRWH